MYFNWFKYAILALLADLIRYSKSGSVVVLFIFLKNFKHLNYLLTYNIKLI
jgi:hypothetical protein